MRAERLLEPDEVLSLAFQCSCEAVSVCEFTYHYRIIEHGGDHVHHSLVEARHTAGNDDMRIWFIRIIGDGPENEDEEYTGDIEIWHGQFVNCAGFFVSTEPCRPEQRDEIFTY